MIIVLTQLTDEFSAVLSNVHVMCNQSYIIIITVAHQQSL